MFLKRKITTDLLRFSFPIIAGQIGHNLFNLIDLAVAARIDAVAASAIGVSSSFFLPLMWTVIGLVLCLAPLSAQDRGRGKIDAGWISAGLISTTAMGLAIMLLIHGLTLCLDIFELNPKIVPLVRDYLQIVNFSLLPSLYFQVGKEFLQGQSDIKFSNALILIFNLINLGLNIVLALGLGPFPRLGIHGLAWATLVCRWLMFLVLLFYMLKVSPFKLSFDKQKILTIFQQGLPISGGILTEALMFCSVTILIGRMDVITSAAHNIVLNLASLTFVVANGMGSAVSVKVGECFARGNYRDMHQWAKHSMLIGLIFMFICSLLCILTPGFFLGLYTNENEILTTGATLIVFMAIFQIPDGQQTILWGILRGVSKTKRPFVCSFVTSWLLAMPIGVYLCYVLEWGAKGLWIGMCFGLYGLWISLYYLYWKLLKDLTQSKL